MQEAQKSATEPRHYDYIDALRGWAFLAVVLTHCGQEVANLPPRVATFTTQGERGVGLFFVISAFTLISSAYARSRSERHPTRNFLLRRFFRIAPLFWLGMVLYPLISDLGPTMWSPAGIGPLHFLLTATFLHGTYPATFNSVVPGGWSIAVEMMFYLCVPFLIRVITSTTRALWAIFGTVIVSLVVTAGFNRWVGPQWSGDWRFAFDFYFSNWLLAQMPVFLMGFLLFFVLRSSSQRHAERMDAQKRAQSLLLLCASGYLLVDAIYTPGGKYVPNTMRFALAHFLLAWSLALVPWRVLVNPITRGLGTISFSGYLCHFAILFHLLPRLLGTKLAGLPPLVHLIALFILTVALTAVVATITYRFVELPGIALGRRLIRRLEQDRPETLPAATAANG